MIISGGVNIYPAEIEGELLAHPKVADVAVFGIPDDDWGEEIKAVVEPRAGVDAERRARATRSSSTCAAALAKFKCAAVRSTSSTSCRASRTASC